jgi:hypothetical protein
VWTLFPEGQIVNLYLWDYNDVAPAYFAAAQLALSKKAPTPCPFPFLFLFLAFLLIFLGM